MIEIGVRLALRAGLLIVQPSMWQGLLAWVPHPWIHTHKCSLQRRLLGLPSPRIRMIDYIERQRDSARERERERENIKKKTHTHTHKTQKEHTHTEGSSKGGWSLPRGHVFKINPRGRSRGRSRGGSLRFHLLCSSPIGDNRTLKRHTLQKKSPTVWILGPFL